MGVVNTILSLELDSQVRISQNNTYAICIHSEMIEEKGSQISGYNIEGNHKKL